MEKYISGKYSGRITHSAKKILCTFSNTVEEMFNMSVQYPRTFI